MLRSKIRMPGVRGISRPRLDEALEQLWNHRLGLVVAPAGSGKTTLVAHFSAAARGPVAWYRAEAADSSEVALVAHLERALTAALPSIPGGWVGIDDAVAALDEWSGDRALLVVDDLHLLWGTEAEGALDRLVRNLPPTAVVLAATRRAPAFDLSRLRVSSELLELGPDDLRFRSWEVERLFLDFYGERLSHEELAELARRTGGWAAGLQLFHLATRGKPAGERRRLLRELAGQSRMVREYLARNMLDELDASLRSFLLETCVLGRLTPALCDQLLGTSGSAAVLEELEHRRIFTSALDEDGGYRYHEVLRSHLEAVLVERHGDDEARRRYRRAGELLEETGALADALRAYCRAADWVAATRLLGLRGEQVIAGPGAWIEALPASLLEQDPWLLLATARRYVALGRWDAALESYQRAAAGFGAGAPEETCRRERQVLGAWLEPRGVPPADWTGSLRRACRRNPLEVGTRTESGDVPGLLTAGLCALLAGRVGEAGDKLAAVADRPDATPILALAAGVAEGVAGSLAGRPTRLRQLGEQAEALGFPWLAGVARAATALDPGVSSSEEPGTGKTEPWGAALAALFGGIGALRAGSDPVEPLTQALAGFRSVGADVLEAWARATLALALARRRGPEALPSARSAERFAHAAGAHGAVGIACAALAVAEPDQAADHGAAALAVASETRLLAIRDLLAAEPPAAPLPAPAVAPPAARLAAVARPARPPSLTIHCFGGFRLAVQGRPVDLGFVRPRPRAVLHLLALRAGRPVHREQILEAFWPDEHDLRAATRNLQVAVSALRHIVQGDGRPGPPPLVLRSGDSYQLALDEDADVDIVRFERGIIDGHAAYAAGALEQAEAAFERSLAVYTGELLPDDGPAEWVVKDRDRYHRDAADAARVLAEIHLARGEHRAAVLAAERGLLIDRYDDWLWRLLLEGHDRAGDHAGGERGRQRYQAMLAELGLGPS